MNIGDGMNGSIFLSPKSTALPCSMVALGAAPRSGAAMMALVASRVLNTARVAICIVIPGVISVGTSAANAEWVTTSRSVVATIPRSSSILNTARFTPFTTVLEVTHVVAGSPHVVAGSPATSRSVAVHVATSWSDAVTFASPHVTTSWADVVTFTAPYDTTSRSDAVMFSSPYVATSQFDAVTFVSPHVTTSRSDAVTFASPCVTTSQSDEVTFTAPPDKCCGIARRATSVGAKPECFRR